MKITKQKAFALATTLVLLGVVLIGASTVLSVSRIESKISRSQKEGIQAYYVAEAGVQYAIKKINSDSTLAAALQASTLNTSFTLTNKPAHLRDLEINIQSIAPGRAEITSTGKVREDIYAAQRVVKVEIFQGPPSTESILGNYSLFSAGSTIVEVGTVNISGGDLYAGGNQRYTSSTINASENSLASIGSYINNNSTVNADNIFASNYPPAPSLLVQPGVDMNDLRNRANVIYTPTQFRNLIKGGGNIDLPGPITYINGILNISPSNLNSNVNSVTITVHGLLVGNSNINITTSATVNGFYKTINLIILDDVNTSSGMISRTHTKIFGQGTVNIDGVVYAGNTITFSNTLNMSIDGGVVGSSLVISSSTNLSLIGNTNRIGELLGVVTNPSVIEIDHWEEEY